MRSVRTRLAGVEHLPVDARQLVYRLARGAIVELKREPLNRHDCNAVACYVEGVKVGFIPMRDNPPIAAAMDLGFNIGCQVLEPAIDPRFPLRLVVFWKDGTDA